MNSSLPIMVTDAIGVQIERKRLLKCNASEWLVSMPSGGQPECNFAGGKQRIAKPEPRSSSLADLQVGR